MGALDPEQCKEPKYQVAYYTFLASGKQPNIECEVGWKCMKCSLLVRQIFDYIMLTWERIPGSPCFSVLQVTESWAEPENEAK